MINRNIKYRAAYTLLEILIIVAIIAILLALIMPGIQSVRARSREMETKNNLRQIALGVEALSSDRNNNINGLPTTAMKTRSAVYQAESIFTMILPYTFGNRVKPTIGASQEELLNYAFPNVNCYRDASDLSLTFQYQNHNDRTPMNSRCSYGANILAFDGVSKFPLHIQDGNSNTISFTTRNYWGLLDQFQQTSMTQWYLILGDPDFGFRRATFADITVKDVVPVTDPVTKTTKASVPGRTFQVQPKPTDAFTSNPIAFHRSGLTAAFFDGSVRTIAPSVSESVFWSMVTPNGGEVSPE